MQLNGYISQLFTGMNFPTYILVDSSNAIYISNTYNNAILRIQNGQRNIIADASNGISKPVGLVFDASKNLYVANYGNNTISKIDSAGDVSVFVDASAGLDKPNGLAFNSTGQLYSTNGFTKISRIDALGNVHHFVQGSNTSPINVPIFITFNSADEMFITNFNGRSVISKVNSSGSIMTPFLLNSQGITHPRGIAFDTFGNLFISYQNNIVYITPQKKVIPLVTGGEYINSPRGISFDNYGNLLITNAKTQELQTPYANTISKFTFTGPPPTYGTCNSIMSKYLTEIAPFSMQRRAKLTRMPMFQLHPQSPSNI